MLQALDDAKKGQGGTRPRDRGGASASQSQEVARPSAKRGGERVPARPLSVEQSKGFKQCSLRQSERVDL
eukprot:5590747-Amphidinium_carterae.1